MWWTCNVIRSEKSQVCPIQMAIFRRVRRQSPILTTSHQTPSHYRTCQQLRNKQNLTKTISPSPSVSSTPLGEDSAPVTLSHLQLTTPCDSDKIVSWERHQSDMKASWERYHKENYITLFWQCLRHNSQDQPPVIGVGPKLGQIGPKWDTSVFF